MTTPTPTLPRVTVVILAYKRLERLRETLQRTLEDLRYPAQALEVIVVDNASENGTPEMVADEFPSAKVIVLPENVGSQRLERRPDGGHGPLDADARRRRPPGRGRPGAGGGGGRGAPRRPRHLPLAQRL